MSLCNTLSQLEKRKLEKQIDPNGNKHLTSASVAMQPISKLLLGA